MNYNDINYLVAIHCLTFNQKPYIRQCLNGFVMQITNFPFAAIVIDDNSTDNEQEVLWGFINSELDSSTIQRYETSDYIRVVAQHKTNLNCTFVFLFLKYNHHSIKKAKKTYIKEWDDSAIYIATCEGDDYWTDEHKLQKMISFLETHPKYVLACHRINRYIQEKDIFVSDDKANIYFGNKQGVSFGRYYNRFINWKTQTLATIYRKDVLNKALEGYPYAKTDGIKSYFPLKYGKGYCFNEHMATYRVNKGGVWSRQTNKEQIYSNWQMFKNFDSFEKSVFSRLSYWQSYYILLEATNRKGYKDAKFSTQIYVFGKIYTYLKRMITLYYKLRFKIQK